MNDFPSQTQWPIVRLIIRGLGHVPSFKNKKRAIKDSRTGQMRTMTEEKTAQWMKRCIQSFEYQLRSCWQTDAGGTQTERLLPFWIASFVPQDDSVNWTPQIRIDVRYVENGQEGAEICIERL